MTTDTQPRTGSHASAPAAAPAIRTNGLTKAYSGRTVVDRLDLTVPAGVVSGFVGPNGAGKTTTIRMLLGLVRPTAGTGAMLGEPLHHPARYLGQVGALPGSTPPPI
jgi:ABC-2 type transport system ATP-binding protein